MLKIFRFGGGNDLIEEYTEPGNPRSPQNRFHASMSEEVVAATADEMDEFLAEVEGRARARAMARLRN